MDEGCSRTFNLCGSIYKLCTTVRQDQSTELPTVPTPQARTDSVMMKPNNVSPTNISCTPIITITSCTTTATVSPDSTVSTIEQNYFKVTSVILATITETVTVRVPLIITHTISIIVPTQCPQTTTELMATTITNERESIPCTPITSTKFIATTVLPPLQSCAPQFTTTPKLNITKSPTTSLGLESCLGNKPGVCLQAQGNGSSNTTSALGALLGLSLVLLALVSIGWVWACWTARKRGEVNINSKTNKLSLGMHEPYKYSALISVAVYGDL